MLINKSKCAFDKRNSRLFLCYHSFLFISMRYIKIIIIFDKTSSTRMRGEKYNSLRKDST